MLTVTKHVNLANGTLKGYKVHISTNVDYGECVVRATQQAHCECGLLMARVGLDGYCPKCDSNAALCWGASSMWYPSQRQTYLG